MGTTGFVNLSLCNAPAWKLPSGAKRSIRPGAWKSIAASRGGQAASLLLATVPLAERMLLYHAATAVWIMLPDRTQVERGLASCYGRLHLSRRSKCIARA
jgi:hypothetical protein